MLYAQPKGYYFLDLSVSMSLSHLTNCGSHLPALTLTRDAVRLWNDKAEWAKLRQKILDSPMSELDVVMLEKELNKVGGFTCGRKMNRERKSDLKDSD